MLRDDWFWFLCSGRGKEEMRFVVLGLGCGKIENMLFSKKLSCIFRWMNLGKGVFFLFLLD